MTAVAGIWHFDENPGAASDCSRMLAAQEIYGPHDGRQWSEGSIALGRRLFRLLPEDAYDLQPLQSTDGRLVLVADIRLDNRDELTSALSWTAGQTADLCDAAMLLACLERWGEGALDRIVGDFAFALWDSREKRLLLARDYAGQRPLHYHRAKSFFAFATMAKGLHTLADVPNAPDEQLIAEFVTLIPHTGPRSFFKDIERVEPGHVVRVSRAGLVARRYWNPQGPQKSPATTSDYVEGIRFHLDQATRSRLRGTNGAVASTLSGGFDSSAVTATAARLMAPSGGRVTAFTAVPREGYEGPDPKFLFGDEGPHAAATAAMYPNIEHVLIRSGHLSPLEGIDRDFFLFERPILNRCNWVWGRAIYEAMREKNLRVLLIGEGGNMSLNYVGDQLLPELVRSGRLVRLAREMTKLIMTGELGRFSSFKTAFGPFIPMSWWPLINRMLGRQTRNVLRYTAISKKSLSELDLRAIAKERGLDFAYRPWSEGFAMRLWVIRRIDGGNYNKGALAGWGIDERDPTADRRLVEYCLKVPMDQYLADGRRRALGRRALSDRLPNVVLNETRSGNQGIDWHEGFSAARSAVAVELEQIGRSASAARILDLEKLKKLVDDWPAKGWEEGAVEDAYRLALLRGISAGHFLRKASRSN